MEQASNRDEYSHFDEKQRLQQRLSAIEQACSDALIGVSPTGLVNSWSKGAEQLYGYEPDEILARPLETLWPREAGREAASLLIALLRGESLEEWGADHVAKSGRSLHVAISAMPMRGEKSEVTGAILIARDCSQQHHQLRAMRELEASAEHRALVLDTANRVALDILASRTGVEALRHIADAARVLSGARYAALGVAQPSEDGQYLSEFVTVGLTPEEEAKIGPRPKGIGVLGLLLRLRDPLRISRLGDHPDSVGFPPGHPEMDSFLGVPIRRGEEVVGSLYLTNKQGGDSFTEADELAVQALGAHAAVAIHHMHMLSRQRALVSGMITAQEEERRAVAYDLHDGLTQFVMASHAHLEAFKRAHAKGNEERAARELEAGLKYLKESVVESRRLVNGLRSLALDDLGLSGALEQLINEEKARTGWEDAELVHNIADFRFDKTLETGAYRIAQEALTNIRKHADAKRVQMVLLLEKDAHGELKLHLQIRDWGSGFDAEAQAGRATQANMSGIGLQGMSERAQLLGGTLNIRSTPGSGSTITAILPVRFADEDENGSSNQEN